MRSAGQRRSDAIEKLEGDMDVWVATAGGGGGAHLVPLSLCWHEGEVIVATEARSRTARNAASSGQARLALGSTRDVVIIDAGATVIARADAGPDLVAAYLARTGWDPGDPYVYLRLRPVTVQVWRDEAEMPGRTVMRDGRWVVSGS